MKRAVFVVCFEPKIVDSYHGVQHDIKSHNKNAP